MDNNSNNKMFVVVFLVVSALGAGLMLGLLGGKPFEDNSWLSQLYFAAGTLGALAFILIVAMAMYVWGPAAGGTETETRGKVVFEAITKIVPPLVTLILGYYFGLQGQMPSTKKESTGTEITVGATKAADVKKRGETPSDARESVESAR